MTGHIKFFREDVKYRPLKEEHLSAWLIHTILMENAEAGEISIIFCSDNFLAELNLTYLKHDTLTDIITFQYEEKPLSGDLFISINRVEENALKYKVPFEEELRRVMIHGILHLCGYKDKTLEEKALMRQKENEYLEIFSSDF